MSPTKRILAIAPRMRTKRRGLPHNVQHVCRICGRLFNCVQQRKTVCYDSKCKEIARVLRESGL